MPSSYSLYEMTAFPELGAGEIVAAPLQLLLDLQMEGIEEPPKTEFTALRRIPELDMDVFRVFHEYIVRKPGRAKGVSFNIYIANANFPAYYQRINQLLLIKTSKDIAEGAFKALSKGGRVKGQRRNISLKSIRPYIDRFKGAWFNVDGSANVKSQALFGPSIDQDMRFERASDEGEMYYIRLDYVFKDELTSLGVSNDSSIVIYDDNLDEVSELELVLHIKKNLLDKAELA